MLTKAALKYKWYSINSDVCEILQFKVTVFYFILKYNLFLWCQNFQQPLLQTPMLKAVMFLNIFVKTMYIFFRILWWIESKWYNIQGCFFLVGSFHRFVKATVMVLIWVFATAWLILIAWKWYESKRCSHSPSAYAWRNVNLLKILQGTLDRNKQQGQKHFTYFIMFSSKTSYETLT